MTLEDMHQEALFQWASRTKAGGVSVSDYLFAIPNGGWRSHGTAKVLKRCGVKAGVSDLFLPVPRGTMHGLWIELKAPAAHGKRAGKATQEQLDWLDLMGGQGYAAVLCVGWTEAAKTIKEYLECAA